MRGPSAFAIIVSWALAATAAPVSESVTFETLLGDRSVGREVVTRTTSDAGPVLTSHATVAVPGGPSLVFDQEATLSPDGRRIVAYELNASGAGRDTRITARPTETGWSVEAGPPDGAAPAARKDLSVTGPSVVVDNNLASHLDLLCHGLTLGPGEKLATTVVVPQVLMAIPATVSRQGEARGTLEGAPADSLRYRLEVASVVMELDCARSDGSLLEARVPMQKATYRRVGYEAAATPVEAADPREHDVEVDGPALKLPAVVTLPVQEAPVPIVVMLSGSGPNDRDETIGPNKPFRDLARGLADRGVASLRFDKRAHHGKGATGLDDEYVADARAAIALARGTTGVDPSRVFLLGHSLGAPAALVTASAVEGLRGLVLMAGPARPIDALLVDQMTYQMKLVNVEAAEIEAQRRQIEEAFARYRDPKSMNPPPYLGASAAYWRDLLAHDEAAMLRATKLPALVLQGGKDIQVRKEADFDSLREKVGDAGGRVTYRSFPELNHLFMKVDGASTGGEYAIAGHVDPEVPEAIASWVLAH